MMTQTETEYDIVLVLCGTYAQFKEWQCRNPGARTLFADAFAMRCAQGNILFVNGPDWEKSPAIGSPELRILQSDMSQIEKTDAIRELVRLGYTSIPAYPDDRVGPSHMDSGRLWGFILLAVAIASIPNVIWVLWDMFNASK